MVGLLTKKISFLFSSDPLNGAINKSENGSDFTVQLNEPISIPDNAVDCSLRLLTASIWFTTPNISIALNNNTIFYFNGANKIIVIDDGLYSLGDLNLVIARELVLNGDPSDLFTLVGDNSTQKVLICFTTNNVTIDFTPPNTPRILLGFDSIVTPASVADTCVKGTEVAAFNSLEAYLITGNLISDGIPANSINSGIMAFVLPDAQPGFQINFAPFVPISVSATELIGKSKNVLRFSLRDQNLVRVDTNEENYSFTVEISYTIPFILPQLTQRELTQRG